MATLPLDTFPGFSQVGVVNPSVLALATIFNGEGIEALQGIPTQNVAWADVGSRVTKMMIGKGLIPIRLTSLLGFEPMEGERHYHPVNVSTVEVKVAPYQLNLEWPVQLEQAGIQAIKDVYGISGIANDVVEHARAYKADLVASLLIAGQTNSSLSMTAKAYTLAQPSLANGLPLFSDGSTSGSTTHYANPTDSNSKQFSNLTLNAGKITASGVMSTVLTDMSQVPHPSKNNMTLGLQVTDIIGGTNMLGPFINAALQQLALQTTTSPGNIGVASTNVFTNEMLSKVNTVFANVSGLGAVRYHIAPQLDAHPYIVAHPTYQMWYAISQSRPSLKWAELGGPNPQFTPMITLFGDQSEECKKSRKIRLLGDLDGGIAAGMPHAIHAYFETTP
jgi:hypothetical protein